jgi:hypothetical protein
MQIKDLDNNIYHWKLTGYTVNGNNDRPSRSELHLRCRKLLKERFPTSQILEEVTINLHRHQIAYLDFYIPLFKICVEVQGEQHFKFIPHFHGSIAGFMKSRRRDEEKREWTEKNGIILIELAYNESIEQWKMKLQ